MKYKKVALIFPGQGSQYVGMGKEFYDRFKLVRDIYDEAGTVMGYDIAEKCFKKPIPGTSIIHKPDLDRTIYTQPAVMVTGYACYRIFEEMCREVGVHPMSLFLPVTAWASTPRSWLPGPWISNLCGFGEQKSDVHHRVQ